MHSKCQSSSKEKNIQMNEFQIQYNYRAFLVFIRKTKIKTQQTLRCRGKRGKISSPVHLPVFEKKHKLIAK